MVCLASSNLMGSVLDGKSRFTRPCFSRGRYCSDGSSLAPKVHSVFSWGYKVIHYPTGRWATKKSSNRRSVKAIFSLFTQNFPFTLAITYTCKVRSFSPSIAEPVQVSLASEFCQNREKGYFRPFPKPGTAPARGKPSNPPLIHLPSPPALRLQPRPQSPRRGRYAPGFKSSAGPHFALLTGSPAPVPHCALGRAVWQFGLHESWTLVRMPVRPISTILNTLTKPPSPVAVVFNKSGPRRTNPIFRGLAGRKSRGVILPPSCTARARPPVSLAGLRSGGLAPP